MNSFIGVFQEFYIDFKNAVLSPPCLPHLLTQASSQKVLKSPSPPSSPPTFSPVENPVSYIKLNENRAVARAFICRLPESLTRTYNETFPGFNNWHTLATFIDVCMIFDMQMLICTHIFSL